MEGMRKTRRSRRPAADPSTTVDIVSQLECAIRNPHATLIGALAGGLVPWFARTLAHDQLPVAWSSGNHGLATLTLVVVLGCSLFSALSVYKFGRATFSDARKAIGFTLALEGVMLVSQGVTSGVALATLVLINALGNGSTIALARAAACRRREADARRAATRRSRTSVHTSTRTAPTSSKRATFPVVDVPVHAPQRATMRTPVVRWNPTMLDGVIDGEVVSERRTKLLA
jgi:hypothetical protein